MTTTTKIERAAVTFPAANGVDSLIVFDGDVVAFGRSRECDIRIGLFPVEDLLVSRVAGRLIVNVGRVLVECPAAPNHSALDVHVAGQPVYTVAVGAVYGPPSTEFTVVVAGERSLKLSVAVRAMDVVSGPLSGAPTQARRLDLSAVQRSVIEAYLEPMRRGRLEPASHREVAETLDRHQSSVREVLYDVWARMFALGIPMPDVSDKRVAVIDAIRHHSLLG
jgi:hypothetical protein